MAGRNEATVKFRADTSKFTEEIKKADQNMSTLRKEMKLADAEFKNTGDSTDYYQKKTNILTAELQENRDKQDALNQKLQAAEKYFGKNSDEARRLQGQLLSARTAEQRLITELNSAERAAKDAGGALEDSGEQAQDAGRKAEDSSDGWSMTKDVIASMAKDAIDGAIDGFKELATEGEQSLNRLDAATGASDAQMGKYKQVMEDVYNNNYGDSMRDVSDAMATVIQVMGEMDDSSLRRTTENAMALDDVFDMDVKESIRAANTLMDQFGISSDEAFNLIVQGAQNGLNQNDDLLDTINEYSVQFKTAGYDADDMFNMLANGAGTGTWSIDKLGDAVKEYNIRWKDGTAQTALERLGFNADDMAAKMETGGQTSGQAMQQVIAALMGVEDEQERYKLGQELMGTMWEDLGEKTVTSLMNTNGEISKTTDAMNNVKTTAYDDIASDVSTLGRTLQSDLIAPVVNVATPGIKNFLGFIQNNLPIIEPLLVGLAATIGTVAVAVAGIKIAGLIQSFGSLASVLAVIGGPVTLVIAVVAGLAAGLAVAYNKSETFRNVVNGAFNAVKSVVTGAVNGIVGGIKKFASGIMSIPQKAAAMKDSAVQKFNQLKNSALKPITSLVSSAQTKFNQLKDKITKPVETARDKVKGVIDKIKGFFKFEWSLPKLKLPHLSISGKFSLTPPSVPKFSIKWYKKAVENPVILNGPTIFGAADGKLLGGGEAGREVVSGADTLMRMISNAVLGASVSRDIDYDLLANKIATACANTDNVIILNERELGRFVRKVK